MENKTQPIAFFLKKITTEQFAIVEESFVEEKDVDLSVNLRFGADMTSKLIVSFASFQFVTEKQPFIIIEIGCHFGIEQSAWDSLYNAEDGTIKFNNGFMAHLAMLTVGTVRGVLHAKTENTIFNQFILPTINVADLIKGDIEFKEDILT